MPTIEESEEQWTVVFALVVTEPASVGGNTPPPPNTQSLAVHLQLQLMQRRQCIVLQVPP
jgi:hypothetical protein